MNTVTAQDVANYFLYVDAQDETADGISHLKMQKLVYYAYGFYYAIFAEKLFDEHITAWKHGPVCESLYHTYNGYGKSFIPFNAATFDETIFSEEQRDFLDEIYREYSQHSAWKLSEMTHDEMPWINGRNRIKAGNHKGQMLDSDILEHFEAIVSLNETESVLRDHPDIFERIAKTKEAGYQGIPLDEAIARLGVSI